MTNRTRWLVFLALVGVVVGINRGQSTLVLVSLATFLWILLEWTWFQLRVRAHLPRLQIERWVNGRNESSGTLWAGRKVHVELKLSLKTPLKLKSLRNLVLRDVLPEILEAQRTSQVPMAKSATSGGYQKLGNKAFSFFAWCWPIAKWRSSDEHPNQWSMTESPSNTFTYSALARAVGCAKLPGVRISVEHPFGLFQVKRFFALEQSFRILPDYFQSGDMRPTIKRHNSLPSHGIHRLQRSGVSSELLELREYVVGDPPKSIAWKASARRDKLMTRQYESEVPVRVQMFVDGSVAMRLGGFGVRLLDQTNYVAASLAKAAISVGDPVSGTLIDESGAQRLPWFAGDLGFLQLLKALAEFADRSPPVASRLTPYMLHCAFAVCQERYPHLLDRNYQPIPFSFFSATRERYRLIGVLAEVFQLSPREQTECYCDDESLAKMVQRFLFRAGMPWMAPLLPADFVSELSQAKCTDLLSKAMSIAIARARDNEVFVVLADPQSCAQHLNDLLPVVRLALAKHHRVAFVCPTSTFSRPSSEAMIPRSESVDDLLLVAEQAKARELKAHLSRELVRLGVAVAYSGERSAIQMVLAEMDMARAGRSRIHGART